LKKFRSGSGKIAIGTLEDFKNRLWMDLDFYNAVALVLRFFRSQMLGGNTAQDRTPGDDLNGWTVDRYWKEAAGSRFARERKSKTSDDIPALGRYGKSTAIALRPSRDKL
jgi:hypothetical protein